MIQNKSRFSRDFPQTLAQNLTQSASKDYISRKRKEYRSQVEFTWAIRGKDSGTLVGLIILKRLDWKTGVGEFAYCIEATFSGKGLMTETVSLMTVYAFEKLGLRILWIIAHESNRASISVAEKCGYVWVKRLLHEHTPPDGIPLDMELYQRCAII